MAHARSDRLGIVLTGAASGVGRGLAKMLAEKGHRIFMLDRDRAALDETGQWVGAQKGRVSPHAVDVTSSAQIGEFFNAIRDERVDVLVNNAGLQHVAGIEAFPEERWDLLVDVMLKGPFLMTKAALPRMREQGFGRIVNIGSIHSLVASPFKAAYVAAKHGLVGLAKVVTLEAAGVDITINTICPAYVRTPLVDAQIQAQAAANGISEEQVIERIMLEPMPKKAFITVEEIGATIEFLISHAARNITAQTIAIDGGWTAR